MPRPHAPTDPERLDDLQVYRELLGTAGSLQEQSLRCWTPTAGRAYAAASITLRLVASALFRASLADANDAGSDNA